MAKDPLISTDVGRGATILTAYAKRQVKAYPIFESELDSIAFLNSMTLVFFSLSSALFSLAVGIWTNAAFAEKLTPEAALLVKVGGPILCILALIALGLGLRARHARHTEWTKIKGQSSEV